MLLLVVIFVVLGIIAWVGKVKFKRNMESRLGRKVKDGELTSITAWMEVTDEDKGPSSNTTGQQKAEQNAEERYKEMR